MAAMPYLILSIVLTFVALGVTYLTIVGVIPDVGQAVYNHHVDSMTDQVMPYADSRFNENRHHVRGIIAMAAAGETGCKTGNNIPTQILNIASDPQVVWNYQHSWTWLCMYYRLADTVQYMPSISLGVAVICLVIKGYMSSTVRGGE